MTAFLKKYFIFLVLILLMQSCNNKQKTKTNYDHNGNIVDIEFFDTKGLLERKKKFSDNGYLISEIEYYNEKMIKIMYYNNNRLISDFFLEKKDLWKERIYYDNITIQGSGKIDNQGRQIGWWSFFDENNILKEKQEFMIIDNQQYLNQGIIFKQNGDIDLKHSFFIILNIEKVKDKNYACKLNYINRINKKSEIVVCVGNDIKEDFTNVSDVKLDTINLKNKNFPIVFEKAGRKKIRGFVLERYPKNPNKNTEKEKIEYIESKIYFEKNILVD